MFENYKVYEIEYGGKKMTFETGKMCCLSLVCAQQRGIAARDVPSDVRQLIPHPSRYSLRRHNV